MKPFNIKNRTHMKSKFHLLAAACVVGTSLMLGGCARDDTDSVENRSGMWLYVDVETGCQYVARTHQISPRYKSSKDLFCGATDGASYLKDSGAEEVTIKTDFGTGCQYVTGASGRTITPRLNKEGEPMCKQELAHPRAKAKP
jgi:hypothetical protein